MSIKNILLIIFLFFPEINYYYDIGERNLKLSICGFVCYIIKKFRNDVM